MTNKKAQRQIRGNPPRCCTHERINTRVGAPLQCDNSPKLYSYHRLLYASGHSTKPLRQSAADVGACDEGRRNTQKYVESPEQQNARLPEMSYLREVADALMIVAKEEVARAKDPPRFRNGALVKLTVRKPREQRSA
jgi:hypothetical protein